MPNQEKPPVMLDVRNLPPPQPLELALEAVFDLRDDQALLLRIHREPTPLYAMLQRDGYQYRCTPQDDGYLIRIWRARPCSAP